jgi:hypothetical protein
MTLKELVLEWSYKLDKGYPDMDNPSDIQVLKEMLEQLNLPTDDILDKMSYANKDGKPGTTGLEPSPYELPSKQTKSIEDEDDEISPLRTQLGSHSKKDLLDLINKIDLDEKQIQKLYHRISNFSSYRPILKSLRASNYKELVVKRYSSEIQNLIEDLDPKENEQFIDYLNNPEKQLDFPTKSEGNLFALAPSDKIPTSVMSKIIAHTTQDEGKRGVGMGELGMALVFRNITDSRGKGDLALNGEEFEIKGDGATLGEKPDAFPVDMSKLEPFGIKRIGTTYEIGEGENIEIVPNKNKFALALSLTHKQTKDKEGFKNALKDTLANDVGHGEAVNALFNKINFDNPETIQQEIALMNLYRYANKEQYRHFLVHDFGKAGDNTGKYVYGGGSPESIVNSVRGKAKFDKLSWNDCRPRIGFQRKYLEEDA